MASVEYHELSGDLFILHTKCLFSMEFMKKQYREVPESSFRPDLDKLESLGLANEVASLVYAGHTSCITVGNRWIQVVPHSQLHSDVLQ